MKKIMTLALAFAALVSCSKENDGIDPNAPVEIKLNAGIQATARAAINQGDPVSGVQFVRIDGETADFSKTTAITMTGDIAANGNITFSNTQYYPTDGNTHIIGFYPVASPITTGIAKMTITGVEDVMYAGVQTGSKGSAMPALSFAHKLTQFKFVIKRDATTTDKDIENVKVAVINANTTFDMALADGELKTWATPSTITPITAGKAATEASIATEAIMLEPDMTKITLMVSANNYAEKDIEIAGTDNNKFEVGKSYLITLTFTGTDITPTATIAAWTPGTGAGSEIK